jgi:hypothetical protein
MIASNRVSDNLDRPNPESLIPISSLPGPRCANASSSTRWVSTLANLRREHFADA